MSGPRLRNLLLLALLATSSAPGSEHPRPDTPAPLPPVLAVWAHSPLETRILFETPLPPDFETTLVPDRVRHKSPPLGDDPEPVVLDLAVAAARVAPNRRVLRLATDPHTLPGDHAVRVGAQEHIYDLDGLEAVWTPVEPPEEPNPNPNPNPAPDANHPRWAGWLPAPDLESARNLARTGSEDHAELGERLRRPGALELRAWLRPSAKNPNPNPRLALRARANRPFRIAVGFEEPVDARPANPDDPRSPREAELLAEIDPDDPPELWVEIQTGPDPASDTEPDADPAFVLERRPETDDDPHRPFQPGELAPLWAVVAAPPPFPLEGGDPRAGLEVFRGEAAKCALCHARDGRKPQIGEVGPPLDDLARRELAWIYRQIAEPSARIHPRYRAHTLAMNDGRALVGILRALDFETVRVSDTDARATDVPRDAILEIRPAASSVMPAGLGGVVGEPGLRDLLAYLRAQPRDLNPTPTPTPSP